jgi:hypothetical protein
VDINEVRKLEQIAEAGCSMSLAEAIDRLAEGPGPSASDEVLEWAEVAAAFATHLAELDHRTRQVKDNPKEDPAARDLARHILGGQG